MFDSQLWLQLARKVAGHSVIESLQLQITVAECLKCAIEDDMT